MSDSTPTRDAPNEPGNESASQSGSQLHWSTGLASVLLLILLYTPTLLWLVDYWIDNLDHFIGVLAPLICAGLIWLRRPMLQRLRSGHDFRGLWLLTPGVLLHLGGLLTETHLLSGLALPMILHGGALLLLGRDKTAELAFPFWFLLFSFPFLSSVEIYASFPMRLMSTTVAQGMLMPFMEVSRIGTELTTPNLEVAVIAACSGLNYLSTLLMLGVVFAWLSESRGLGRFYVFLSILPVVILANGIRIATVGIIGNLWGREAALGFFHDFSGLVVFILAVLGMVGAGILIHRLFPDPVGDETLARPRSRSDLEAASAKAPDEGV